MSEKPARELLDKIDFKLSTGRQVWLKLYLNTGANRLKVDERCAGALLPSSAERAELDSVIAAFVEELGKRFSQFDFHASAPSGFQPCGVQNN